MSATTTKYGILYPQLADTVASLAATVQQLAGRVDLLLGESGIWIPSMTAAVVSNQAVTLARTYPGNNGASVPGIVLVQQASTVSGAATVFTYVDTWVGSASTITGFTLHALSSTTTTRTFLWRFIPVL